MTRCQTDKFYLRLHELLLQIDDAVPLTDTDQRELANILIQWGKINCPGGACAPEHCMFRDEVDWVAVRGFPCLFDLVEAVRNEWDEISPIVVLPTGRKADSLNAPWIRRPGHYNP
jgi:hypothetical protein